MRRLVYTAAASRDLVEIARYIARESGSPATGRSFVGRLRQQCAKMAALPVTLGRARPELRPDIRSAPYKSYVILFRYRTDVMEVVNIIEAHRDIASLFRNDDHQ